jgi:hypothetical protein
MPMLNPADAQPGNFARARHGISRLYRMPEEGRESGGWSRHGFLGIGKIVTSAEKTSFESRLYSSSSGDALLDRDRIDAIYRASITPYEYWPMTDVGTSRAWMSKDLLFEDPLYLVNYLYASFVAVALYDRGILLSRPRHRSKTT